MTTLPDRDPGRVGRRPLPRARSFKHWVHTTIACPDLTLAVNFSTLSAEREPTCRLTTLIFGDAVRGHVRAFAAEDCRIAAGGSTMRFADSHVVETADRFELAVVEPALGLRVRARLQALTAGSTLHNLHLGGAGALHWSLVPRLAAHGTIEYAGRTYPLAGSPAYRDRNWGIFRFGEVAWDWGYVLPDDRTCPFAVVFARLLDRTRTQILDQGLLVWSGEELLSSFWTAHLALAANGRATGPFTTVPSALALCRPGVASDVPEQLRATAASSRGELVLEFTRAATARVLIPDDRGIGVTAIYESLGRVAVTGCIDGEVVRIAGHGFVETVHA
jgi:hypothetical protein